MKLWRITLNNGDWYLWFSKTKKDAVRGVWSIHYSYDLEWSEFLVEHAPQTEKVPDNEVIVVQSEEGVVSKKTAAEWCEGETAGPFASNTYEV